MSKADDNYKLLRTQLDERLKADKRLAAIADKIAKGTANFADTAKYTQIVSHHMGKVISENIGKITVPLGKEAVCKELLRDHYDLINGVFGEVQVSVDEKMGIHIKPVKPAYPTERVDSWAHSLEDPTVEQSVIERRGQSGAENIGNSMHDDCVKENAKLHDKAGLDCYLVRDAGGGCCAWCAAIAGRYKYADAPDDIFRRHDHCTCTTTYECGRMRQDVWSKRTWEASPEELQARKDAAEAAKPTVNTPQQAKELERQALEKNPVTKLSPEQAQAINEQSKPTVNTKEQAKEIEQQKLMQEQNYVITEKNESNDYSVNRQIVNSKEYHDKFEGITPHKETNEKLYQQSKRLLENRDGRDSERMIALDSRTGSFIVDNLESGIDQSFRTGFTKEQYDLIQSNQGNVILLHNHPGSLRPSGTDILTLWREEKVDASIIVGHDGSVCSISIINRKIPLDKIYEDAYNKYIEEGFPKSYAALKATDKLYETDAFVYIKR